MKTLRLAFTIAAAALSLWCHAETLDLRAGAWEMTSATTITGMLMPKEALDKLPPDRRAKVEEAMRARAGKASAHTTTTCITKQDLDRGQLLKSENEKCSRKVIAQTARHLEVEETCAAPKAAKIHFKADAASAQSYVASMDRTDVEGGKVHIEMSGRWLGETCKKGS